MDNLSFLEVNSPEDFERAALELFHYQYKTNPVYSEYCKLLSRDVETVKTVLDIPFLPIEFFKSHKILCEGVVAEKIFRSSGTTGTSPSNHYITSLAAYEKSFLEGFKRSYGNPEQYRIIGLLPSYVERDDASLAYMVSRLIELSNNTNSGFYLKDLKALHRELNNTKEKSLLIGVSFALLDFAEQYPQDLDNVIIMETGGMKGTRPEMVRKDLHKRIMTAFGVDQVHSEYGMTELMSQAYSKGNGLFESPPWMKVFTREIEDPLSLQDFGKTGGINIIDLANVHSCGFIATQDLGRVFKDGKFEVVGRFDHADVRGCNLMLA